MTPGKPDHLRHLLTFRVKCGCEHCEQRLNVEDLNFKEHEFEIGINYEYESDGDYEKEPKLGKPKGYEAEAVVWDKTESEGE